MELMIEVVTRNNKVLALHKVQGETIRIGRAYDNDLVLQEEHVCPYHAELKLSEDGSLLLVDSGSVNGIKDKHNKQLKPVEMVTSGDVFVFGKVFIRVLLPLHSVAPAKKINVIEDIARAANHWYWSLLAIAIYFLILLVDKYYETYQEVIWSKLTVTAIFSVLALFIFPLLVSIAARVFKKDVKFFTIVTFCYLLAICWLVLAAIGSVLLFNWGDNVSIYIGAELIDYALLMIFLGGSFYLASNMSLQRIAGVSTVLVLAIASLSYINDKGDDKVKLFPTMNSKVLPSKWLLASPESADSILVETQSLYEKATLEAKRRNAEADK
ncbi:FHA domain-containing protein [Psychrosphaera sp. B3R10]|uniref:FHA domain-containing protein n=1 Tax=unclassified Psychrosphaera TaxID=2641570 RepID=UPI001C0898CF|nr:MULTISPECIES: FHA domain-containing protein [unclassified Psychrosphaera]MBU2882522.1 FHA domain-containing protein [Psychrosphaera sp. I2R16]MBU2989460.1 FHA domain-containing protein [Psychrosphaera sp. B3R10]